MAFSSNLQGMSTGAATKPIDYSSYNSAVGGLREAQRDSRGYMGDNLSLAGSQAAGFAGQVGALEQQRGVDPWSFYRGGAADTLSKYADPNRDPSNYYRNRLQQMSEGEFAPDDPSYQWRLQQGQQTVERSLASRGLLGSGNAGIELLQYGQGAASQEYGAQFNRLLQALGGVEEQYSAQQNRLMKLAGIDNAGYGIQRQQLDVEVANNNNYQMGLAASMRPQGNNAGFGSGAI
jgi:hypothetical protein